MAESSDFSNIRTLEELINIVSLLYFNMNRMNEAYYTIFLDPIPKTIQLERYDETGKLITVSIPNRAADRASAYSGVGTPQGKQVAQPGSFYIETTNFELYYKSQGTDAYGWVLLWSQDNFQEGLQYLSPTSEAPDLRKLNMNNAGLGTLVVERGGSGVGSISGIIKGNGTNPFSAAVEGVDYLGPNSMAGVVCYYPVNIRADNGRDAIPSGWLRCDGTAYSRTTYERLFKIIGTSYGAGNGSTTFNVPNLYNHFIRSWDGSSGFNSVQSANVGTHNHSISLNTGNESSHTHGAGSYNVTGNLYLNGVNNVASGDGAFSTSFYDTNHGAFASEGWTYNRVHVTLNGASSFSGSSGAGTSHNHSVNGSTANNSGDSETRVLNKMMVPVIKY